jgi:hypothetical protein
MNDRLPVPHAAAPSAERRAPYAAPRIEPLGDLRELTLGGSPGVGDSGAATTQKCPGCP